MDEKLVIQITAEIADLKKQLDGAKKEIEGLSKKSKTESTEMDKRFKKAGETIGSAVKKGAAIAAAAVTAVGTALVGSVAATEEYRVAQAKLNTAFETAGASAGTAKQTYNDLYRVLGDGDVAVEAANHLAKLTTNEKELKEWTTICQGVYATFGDSLPIEGLTEAANETAKTGQVTGSLADALNWAGISEDAFNDKLAACNDEAEREKLIRETLNGVYDEAAANYEKQAASILAANEAQAKLDASLATIGEAMQPVVTLAKELVAEGLEKLAPYVQSFAENYLPVIRDVLTEVMEKLEAAFNWCVQYQAVLVTIAAAIGVIVAAIGLYNAVAAVKAAMNAAEVTTVWGLVSAYAAQAAATIAAIAPYVLITAAIAAVIAIIVLLVKNWDTVKAKVTEVAKAVWEKVKEMADKVASFFTDMWNKVVSIVTGFKDSVVNKFNEIKTNVTNAIQNAVQSVKDKFNNMKSTAVNTVTGLVSSVTSKFGEIKQGISDKINAAKDAVKSAIDKIKGFFNFSWSLPKLKLPHISITGKFSLSPLSVPKFGISWNALGGVFDKPTLFSYGNSLQGIGEDGAEAVVPLEKNTQWLDRIAERLQGKQAPIILQVDGKTLAQVTCSNINQITRQTGTIPLKIV